MAWSSLFSTLSIIGVSVALTLVVAGSGFRWSQINRLLRYTMLAVAVLPTIMFLCGLPFNQLLPDGHNMSRLREGVLYICIALWLAHLGAVLTLIFAAFTKRGIIRSQSLAVASFRTAMFAPATFLSAAWCFFVLGMATAMLEGVPFM